MNNIAQIGQWNVAIDIAKTSEQYKKRWDLCDCTYCMNFYEAIKTIPANAYKLFTQLGINPSVINHLSHFEENEEKLHHYIGCYPLVGSFSRLDKKSRQTEDEESFTVNKQLSIWFTNDLEFVPGFFPRPVIQLEFEIYLPWVLDEPAE